MTEQPVKNITYVVVSALNRVGLTMDLYDWLEQVALEWVAEVHGVNDAPSVKIAHFKVGNGSRIWSYPSDYIRLSKVGYNSGGEFVTLTRNDNLLVEAEACEPESSGVSNQPLVFGGHYWQGLYYGPIFARNGGRNIAYYKVNDTERQIEFSLDVKRLPHGEALIEYLSTGTPCGDTLVRPVFIEPMRNYLIWQLHEWNGMTDLPYEKAARLEMLYLDSLYNHKGTAFALTASEAMDAVWGANGFSIR
jgi:hypothetical protein